LRLKRDTEDATSGQRRGDDHAAMKTAPSELGFLKQAVLALESSGPGDEPLLAASRLVRAPRLADLVERLSARGSARPVALQGKTANARHEGLGADPPAALGAPISFE
jgi:hypothetical protein